VKAEGASDLFWLFSLGLVTGLRTERYDPAGLGSDIEHFLKPNVEWCV
jgi:hypothetical protein